jgi:hypothetical protein
VGNASAPTTTASTIHRRQIMIGLRVRAAPPGAFTAPGPIGRTVSKQSMSHRAVRRKPVSHLRRSGSAPGQDARPGAGGGQSARRAAGNVG